MVSTVPLRSAGIAVGPMCRFLDSRSILGFRFGSFGPKSHDSLDDYKRLLRVPILINPVILLVYRSAVVTTGRDHFVDPADTNAFRIVSEVLAQKPRFRPTENRGGHLGVGGQRRNRLLGPGDLRTKALQLNRQLTYDMLSGILHVGARNTMPGDSVQCEHERASWKIPSGHPRLTIRIRAGYRDSPGAN
jgi:hypothetical protein